MPMSNTISRYLIRCNIDYHVYPHHYAENVTDCAHAAHIEPALVAKAVVVASGKNGTRHFRVAVVPATREVDFEALSAYTREPIELAKEHELTVLFPDCAVGAVPALGNAYGLPTYVDEMLKNRGDTVYFEAGDHEALIEVKALHFRRLLVDAHSGAFSRARLPCTRPN